MSVITQKRPIQKKRRRARPRLFKRVVFFLLDLTIVAAVLSTLIPSGLRAATITASETFTGTTNIDTTNTTATVDTAHSQARLTSADGWTVRVGGISSSTTLNDVSMGSSTVGWAVGASGKIYKTLDGGFTWIPQTSGVSVDLNGVAAASSSVAWAVGASGTILYTSNGGTTWTAQTSGVATTIYGVTAVSTSVAWAVRDPNGTANVVLSTTNSGTTWSTTYSSSTIMRSVFGWTTSDAIAVGDGGACIRTTDGTSWATCTLTGISEDLHSVTRNSSLGSIYLSGAQGTIIQSSDGAITWTSITSGQNGTDLLSITPIPSTNLSIAVGGSGVILRSDGLDGGARWQVVSSNGESAFRSVSMASTSIGYIASDSGVFKTTDSGATWTRNGPTGLTLRGISARASSNDVWVVGTNGTIITTGSAGANWHTRTSGTSQTLNAVFSNASNKGITVGNSGTVLTTTDTATWTSRTSGTSQNLNGIADDAGTGHIVVGDSGVILSVSDFSSGTPTISSISSGTSANLNGIARGGTNLWAVGSSNTILKSTTSTTTTWTAQTSPLASTSTFRAVVAVDVNTAYAVSDTGIIRTTDGGTTWTDLTSSFLTGAFRSDNTTLLGVGIVGSSSDVFVTGTPNYIVTSTGSGSIWTARSFGLQQRIRSLSCTDSSNCWAFGYNGVILKSTDGGTTWSALTSGVTTHLLGGKMASTSVGWAVGGTTTAPTLIVTGNGGSSWTNQSANPSNQMFRAIDAVSTSVAWIVGNSGTISYTTNGGSSWNGQTSSVTGQLNGVSAPSSSVAWVVGNSGTALVTTNSGSTWNGRNPTGITSNLNGIVGFDSSNAYAVGDGGLILKTSNGGTSWSTLTSGTTADLTAIAAVDSNTLRVTGNGVVLQSTGGTSWSSIATSDVSSTTLYNGVTYPAANVGLIAGNGQTITQYAAAYATPKIVRSTNRNTTSSNVTSATLTATSTLNSQTIAYALSNDGGTTFNTVTSGTPYTFTTTGADLRWRATLSTTDTTTGPILTRIELSAETDSSTGGGSSSGGSSDNSNTTTPTPHAPWQNPDPRTPTVLSPTSVRWNFAGAPKEGVRLLKKGADGGFIEILKAEQPNLQYLDETGLRANTAVTNRYIQSVITDDQRKLADAEAPRQLGTPTLPPSPLPTPTIVRLDDRVVKIRLDAGANEPPLTVAIQDAVSSLWLGEGRALTGAEPIYKKIDEWNDTADGLQIVGLTPNTSYALRVKGHGLNNADANFSPSLGLVTALEPPATIRAEKTTETALNVAVKSTRDDGGFSNLSDGSSGILIENLTNNTSSGWLKTTTWASTDLKPGSVYTFRVRTRQSNGMESAPSVNIAIKTAGESEEPVVEKKDEETKPEATPVEEQAPTDERASPATESSAQPTSSSSPAPVFAESGPQGQPLVAPENSGSGGVETPASFVASRQLNAPHMATINGQPFDPRAPLQHLTIDPQQTPELVLNGVAEPNTVVFVIIESDPFVVTTTSDAAGAWEIRIATALIPAAPEHTLSVQTRRGADMSAKLAVATMDVERPQSQVVTDTLVSASAAATEAVLRFTEQAATVTRRSAALTKEVAQAVQVQVKQVEPQAQVVLTTVVPIAVVINTPLWLLLPQIPMMLWSAITWLLQLLGLRKRRLPWGVVYDAVTKEPIALAIVRIFDAATKRIVETQVTDRAGRFGAMLAAGTFRIEATKGGYRFPTGIVHGKEDNQWTNIYHGDPTKLSAETAVVTVAIPLDPTEEKRPSAKQRLASTLYDLRRAFRRIAPSLTWASSASGWILAASSPTRFNIAIAVVYLAIMIFDRLARPVSLKPWGQVLDAASGAPLALAAVDLVDIKYNKLLRSRLTDTAGRFAFLPPPGQYRLQVRKDGYAMATNGISSKEKSKKFYTGETITITEKAPTLSVTIALKKTSAGP